MPYINQRYRRDYYNRDGIERLTLSHLIVLTRISLATGSVDTIPIATPPGRTTLSIITHSGLWSMFRRPHALIAYTLSAMCASEPLLARETSEFERLFALPLEELVNIYVTSPSQTSRPIQNAANSVTSITAAQIKAMGARTLSDVLKMMPAMQILNRRNGLDSVLIRGIPTGRNSKVLLMIDGAPREEVIFGEWSPDEQIQLANIERIEVIRGPGSALYGSNAYAGIISIFTKSRAPEQTHAAVTVGDFNTRKLEYSTGVALGDNTLLSSGSFYKTDGYPMQADRYGDPTTHDNNVHANNVHLKLMNGHWQASLTLNEYATEYPLYPSPEDKQQEYTFIESNLKRTQQWNNTKWESQLYLYNVHRNFDHQAKNPDGSLNFYSTSDLDTTLFGFRNQINYSYSPQQDIIAGFLVERQQVDHYDETAFISDSQPNLSFISLINKNGSLAPDHNNYAVYAQQESSFLEDALILTGGLRLDRFDQLDSHVSPRLGLTYNASDHWSTKLLWGRAFRKPTLLEQYEIRSDNNSPGNPDLIPEDIETTEVEYTYLFSKKNYASITLFRSKLQDFIQTIDRQPYQNNPDTLSIPGISLEWNSHLTQRWGLPGEQGLSANYTRLNTNLPSVAQESANLMLFSDSEKLGLYLGINYLGRRNAGDAYHSLVENSVQKLRDNNQGYIVLDAGIRWKKLAVEPWQFDLSIHNILNKTYYNPETEPENYYDMTKEPRQVELTASYLF